MVSAVLFLAPGFEEIETATVVDILRRCGVKVVIAGLEPHAIKGGHDIEFVSDASIDEINVKDFDAVICPGGAPGYVFPER